MKITVKPIHIKDQLNAAFSATASKSQVAAYTQLYLVAGDSLKITGTDGEVTHKTNVDELEIKNNYDPTPYFEMALNHTDNQNEFPVCKGDIYIEDWDLITEYE